MIHDAHSFRGEYIDLCAQIECWAADIILSAPARATGKADKMPHMLGDKLKLIRQLAADDKVFSKPARILELLDQIKPLTDLRSDLAHAIVSLVSEGPQHIYAFERPSTAVGPAIADRFWLKREETPGLVTALKQARKELADQKLKD